MARDFELDLGPLRKLIEKSPEAAGRGAKQATDDIKDDWVRGARDIAPLDTGNLRRQIAGDVEGQELNSKVIVTANAKQKGFNYGYYIHEENAGGKSLRTPGTVKKFLDESADGARFKRMLEEEISEALKGAGW
ncbi:hypothetical protein [Bacillus sp. ISL-57]|uniref:hypothetical protein n=1 Tax=Bacillus sp. ISL-57 TaxID=2819135 RepID=UPI001BE6507B|nr:hypothetical protein [Bacillus sp. ISL-57]MBT2714736.1 hypothetical protein [Bacillus sp. ISL-57]